MSRGTDWLESRARLTPAKEALVEAGSGLRLTYADLNLRVNRLAAALQASGVSKGDRIALLAPNGACCFELLFAAGKIGAVFVPLNTRFAVSELAYVLNDCLPRMLVVHDQFAEIWRALALQVNVPNVLTLGEYAGWVGGEGRGVTSEDSFAPVEIDLEDPWAIIYTGGTTGQAKGAVLSHRAILWNSINTIVSWGITEREVTPVYLPMFHTGGLNALAMPVLHMGGTVVIGAEFNPAAVVRVLLEERCTIALLVPTMHHMLTQSAEFAAAEFPHMNTFLSGGAPCPLSIYDAYAAKGLAFKEGYGLTEAGPNNFYIHPAKTREKLGSVGLPMFHNDIRLVDDEGREVAAGETGEIWIRGPHVFSGYWNKPEVTAETLVDGWLRTGDLGRRDADGYHWIVGRKKDMIISGGENVYPLEVEHVLEAHPAVEAVAVVGLPDAKWGEVVTAAVVLARGQQVAGEELKAYCAEKLSRYKIPKRFLFVDELPKTPVGKIDKKSIVSQHGESA